MLTWPPAYEFELDGFYVGQKVRVTRTQIYPRCIIIDIRERRTYPFEVKVLDEGGGDIMEVVFRVDANAMEALPMIQSETAVLAAASSFNAQLMEALRNAY